MSKYYNCIPAYYLSVSVLLLRFCIHFFQRAVKMEANKSSGCRRCRAGIYRVCCKSVLCLTTLISTSACVCVRVCSGRCWRKNKHSKPSDKRFTFFCVTAWGKIRTKQQHWLCWANDVSYVDFKTCVTMKYYIVPGLVMKGPASLWCV